MVLICICIFLKVNISFHFRSAVFRQDDVFTAPSPLTPTPTLLTSNQDSKTKNSTNGIVDGESRNLLAKS